MRSRLWKRSQRKPIPSTQPQAWKTLKSTNFTNTLHCEISICGYQEAHSLLLSGVLEEARVRYSRVC